MANIKGGAKNDILNGTAFADRMQGLGGHDILRGYGGNDQLDGGNGDDRLIGGAGSDTLDGGGGVDTADYSDRTTRVEVTFSSPTQNSYGSGTAREYDAAGNLVGTDTLTGIENVTGGSGNDYIWGDGAANVLQGGAGDDEIVGYSGNDRIEGGAGDDLLDGGWDQDIIDGGEGIDTFFFALSPFQSLNLDLVTGRVHWTGDNPSLYDTLISIENARGTANDDTLRGDDGANILYGIRGSDLIEGRGGDDWLVGDWIAEQTIPGNDTLIGGDGGDWLQGGVGNDLLTGGAGADRFLFGAAGGTDTITDFENGTDQIALYDGLSISRWSSADANGDGIGDSVATLSDGGSIIFLGHSAPPTSVTDGGAVMQLGGPPPDPNVATRPVVALQPVTAAQAQSEISSMTMEGTMGRPVGGKITIKGTRDADDIAVVATGVMVNGTLKSYSEEQIAAGFILKADAGNDTVVGGPGPDEIDGGAGNDRITGGDGLDKLFGGAGNDQLIDNDQLVVDSDPNDGIDPNANRGAIFDGGRGIDTIDFSGSPVAVGIDLSGVAFLGIAVQVVNGTHQVHWESSISGRITGVENLVGSEFNDFLVGNQYDNVIRGGAGDDIIWGGGMSASNDQLLGEIGNDLLYGGVGDDFLTGGAGNDVFAFDGTVANGRDVIFDYTPGEDVVRFDYMSQSPTWSQTSYDGIDSLLGTYQDGSSSITLVGITDASLVTMQFSNG